MSTPESSSPRISLLGRLTALLLNSKRWYDYLFLLILGALPIAWAKWIGADATIVDSQGLEYAGYWDKANAMGMALILPASLFLLRWAMGRIAPVAKPWPADSLPPIVDLVEREQDKQSVYDALRGSILAPSNLLITLAIVIVVHIADLAAPDGVYQTYTTFPQEERDLEALKAVPEKDAMYMFLSVDDPAFADAKVTKRNCLILTAGFYGTQFAILTITVLFIIVILRHNFFFLGRVYQRRKVPEGEHRKYFRINLDDVNKCFGFRRANDAFNTQILILVLAGIGCLVSRYENARMRFDALEKARAESGEATAQAGMWAEIQMVFADYQNWLPDVGQVLIAVIFIGAMLIFTLPSVVKLLPLMPGGGSNDAYHSITGFLREYLSDEDWPYDERPNEAEINELAGRFAENAFWPTGDNRARQLFMFCFWVLFVLIVPLYFSTGPLLAFLVVSGTLAGLATGLLFFLMRRSLAYVDERLVKPPKPGSRNPERTWHKERIDATVFISYRRSDAAAYAGRLHDHLAEHLGKDRIFMDIEAIDAGSDFIHAIEHSLSASDAVIVLIGKTWASTAGADGQPRLADPGDFVRLEVATALQRDMEVFPVLVGGAQMPSESELPEALHDLCRRNALEITDTRWSFDVGRLVEGLRRVAQSRAS